MNDLTKYLLTFIFDDTFKVIAVFIFVLSGLMIAALNSGKTESQSTTETYECVSGSIETDGDKLTCVIAK